MGLYVIIPVRFVECMLMKLLVKSVMTRPLWSQLILFDDEVSNTNPST